MPRVTHVTPFLIIDATRAHARRHYWDLTSYASRPESGVAPVADWHLTHIHSLLSPNPLARSGLLEVGRTRNN